MEISIPYSPSDQSIIPDVLARLGVIYPNLKIVAEKNEIRILNVSSAQADNVKQAGLDQLIRSRFDARSTDLREALYKRLLA